MEGSMRRPVVAVGILLAVFAMSVAHAQSKTPPGSQGPQPPPETIEIDGSKNPELIPQWSAWEFAFRAIAGGRKELPTIVHRVVSTDEAAMIVREAEMATKLGAGCETRMARLRPLIGKEKASVLDARAREVTLDCRRQTLDVRDRVLEHLNPEAQGALRAFVESTKAGTSVTLRKKQLARYLEPE
jgi:hypothetical protein